MDCVSAHGTSTRVSGCRTTRTKTCSWSGEGRTGVSGEAENLPNGFSRTPERDTPGPRRFYPALGGRAQFGQRCTNPRACIGRGLETLDDDSIRQTLV